MPVAMRNPGRFYVLGQSSTTLHEAADKLSSGVVDRHRAIVSLMEELEAADWYAQRVEAATDDELRAILRHNGDEEKEHAAMVLEWLRRHDPALDAHLRTYLFSEGSIMEREEQAGQGEADGGNADGCLGIGSLRQEPVRDGRTKR
jgi:uncharacterized protein